MSLACLTTDVGGLTNAHHIAPSSSPDMLVQPYYNTAEIELRRGPLSAHEHPEANRDQQKERAHPDDEEGERFTPA